MREKVKHGASEQRLRALAEFRYKLRGFLLFSEEAAVRFGLQPQQHQLLLQVAGASEGAATTVGYAAERLGLRHNSVVELSKRCEEAELLTREHDDPDRRRVLLRVTEKGRALLDALSLDHAHELHELGPQLIRTLAALQESHGRANQLRQGDRDAV